MQNLEKIIEGCQKGQRSFQKLLYDRYSPILMGICMRYAHTNDEAEDILQEALMKAFTHMSDFKEDASFKTWLWTIIRREFINFVTRPKTRSIGVPIIGEFSDGDSFEDEIAKKQRSEALWRLIGELSVDEQEVIILVDMEGYRYDEAAEMIGLTVPALKSRLFRARKKLIKQAVEQRKLFL